QPGSLRPALALAGPGTDRPRLPTTAPGHPRFTWAVYSRQPPLESGPFGGLGPLATQPTVLRRARQPWVPVARPINVQLLTKCRRIVPRIPSVCAEDVTSRRHTLRMWRTLAILRPPWRIRCFRTGGPAQPREPGWRQRKSVRSLREEAG